MLPYPDYTTNKRSGRPEADQSSRTASLMIWMAWLMAASMSAVGILIYVWWGPLDITLCFFGIAAVLVFIAEGERRTLKRKKTELVVAQKKYEAGLEKAFHEQFESSNLFP